jgi:hypothetical protein
VTTSHDDDCSAKIKSGDNLFGGGFKSKTRSKRLLFCIHDGFSSGVSHFYSVSEILPIP